MVDFALLNDSVYCFISDRSTSRNRLSSRGMQTVRWRAPADTGATLRYSGVSLGLRVFFIMMRENGDSLFMRKSSGRKTREQWRREAGTKGACAPGGTFHSATFQGRQNNRFVYGHLNAMQYISRYPPTRSVL